jgi:hypothetical protein
LTTINELPSEEPFALDFWFFPKGPLFCKDQKYQQTLWKEGEKEWLEYGITIIMIKFSQASSSRF